MKVDILLNLPRTIDGQAIGPFRKGQQVDLPDDVAKTFIGSAMAKEVIPPAPAKKDEAKSAASTKKSTGAAKSK